MFIRTVFRRTHMRKLFSNSLEEDDLYETRSIGILIEKQWILKRARIEF